MRTAIRHLRGNAIAYLALFVALGGTGYAAVSIPAGSVGTRQLKNHSITPVKFNPSAISGSVRYWAEVSASGKVIASSPHAQLKGWDSEFGGGELRWGHKIPSGCTAFATVDQGLLGAEVALGYVAAGIDPGGTGVQLHMSNPSGQGTPLPVAVVVVCA